MGQSLANMVVPEAVIVAQIEKKGEKLIVPEGISLQQAKDLIERRMAYEEEDVDISRTYDVFPWDGAVALSAVLAEKYGWAQAVPTPGFFGDNPPEMRTIDVDYDKTVTVAWGRFSIPNVRGFISTSMARKDGRVVFMMEAQVKRMYEGEIRKLFEDLSVYLKHNSIYQGKAISMRFKADNGRQLPMPEPKFMNVLDIDENQLVFSRVVANAVETNLFTPIRRIRDLKANGLPVKRGVLLGGTFGTGKTMAAKVAGKYAVQQGVTFLYVKRADELAEAIAFAKQYQDPGCVIFCEDVDRSTDGKRTAEMDDLLNIVDGIDTKSSNIIVVLTSNNMEGINPAMLRPGRLDAVIEVLPPDAQAVEKLVRLYGGESISLDEDLSKVGELLAGRIPALIAEVVKRSKLSELTRTPPGELVRNISAAALEEAAESMELQLGLLYRDEDEAPLTVDTALSTLVERKIADAIAPLAQTVDAIKEEVS